MIKNLLMLNLEGNLQMRDWTNMLKNGVYGIKYILIFQRKTKQYRGVPWREVCSRFDLIEKFYKEKLYYKNIKNGGQKHVEEVEKGLRPKEVLLHEYKSLFGKYIAFLDRIQNRKARIEDIICSARLHAFINFLAQSKKANNTIANTAKALSEVEFFYF